VSGLPVKISGEHSGAITGIEGQVVSLSSPKAFPPGQPLVFTLTESALHLEARTIGSKRLATGDFELRVRLINLRKDTREALEQAWAALART
jgi:hypothetical protein